MTGSFFRIVADQTHPDDWALAKPRAAREVEIDPRSFTVGRMYDGPTPETVDISRYGNEVDFNFCAFDMVLSRRRLNIVLGELASRGVQRFPVAVGGGVSDFEILNVLDLVRCFDMQKSIYQKWGPRDGRSDRLGQLRMVVDLRIIPELAVGHHLFRVKEWPIALVVSSTAKGIFDSMSIGGVSFLPV